MENRIYKEYQEKDIQPYEYTKELYRENIKNEIDFDSALSVKLEREYRKFIRSLYSLNRKEIINRSYEITVKEQIKDILKEMNLHEVEKEILYFKDDLLTELYQDWLHHDSSLKEPITDSVDKSISIIVRNFGIKDKER